MPLDREVLSKYRTHREARDKSALCHAPFTNLEFQPNGNVTACRHNQGHVLGTFPKNSIEEIWKGSRARELRERARRFDMPDGCTRCLDPLSAKNFRDAHCASFDRFRNPDDGDSPEWPRRMEFLLSNTCNFECIMCNGRFSSSIRRNRERLPPVCSPYDESFVEQLRPFVRRLEHAKFLGGEPFLNRLNFRVWELLKEESPETKVFITTNGSILGPRVRSALDGLNAHLIVSVDSLEPATYERIRVNSDYPTLRKHLKYFLRYSQLNGRMLSLSMCVMTNNWPGVPELARFCRENQCRLFFSVVSEPASLSLRSLDRPGLERVASSLESLRRPPVTPLDRSNDESYAKMLDKIRTWAGPK